MKVIVLPASILKSLNVLEPEICKAKALVVAFQKLLYVFDHHMNVVSAVNAPVNLIVDVPALTELAPPVSDHIFQVVNVKV